MSQASGTPGAGADNSVTRLIAKRRAPNQASRGLRTRGAATFLGLDQIDAHRADLAVGQRKRPWSMLFALCIIAVKSEGIQRHE